MRFAGGSTTTAVYFGHVLVMSHMHIKCKHMEKKLYKHYEHCFRVITSEFVFINDPFQYRIRRFVYDISQSLQAAISGDKSTVLLWNLASHFIIIIHLRKISFVSDKWTHSDDSFKCTFFLINVCILIRISLGFVPKGLFNNKPALVQLMAWCQTSFPMFFHLFFCLKNIRSIQQPSIHITQ